jgi:hypothetical protein
MRSRLKLGFGFLNLKMVCTPNSVEWMISTVYLGGEGKMPMSPVGYKLYILASGRNVCENLHDWVDMIFT